MRTVRLTVAIIVVASTASAHAAPSLRIRGRVDVSIDKVQRLGPLEARVEGQLRDRYLRAGLAGRRVAVVAETERGRTIGHATTKANGRFVTRMRLGAGRYRITARYRGDAYFAQGMLAPAWYDVTKETLGLRINGPPRLAASAETQRLEITSRGGRGPVSLPVDISLPDGSRRTVRTDARGKARVDVPTKAFGRPGPVLVTASFAGNDRFNAARGRLESTLVGTVHITLQSNDDEVASDERIGLAGVVTETGGPLAGALVSVEAMGRHVASAVADRRGRFELTVPADDFPPGPVDLVAHFDANHSWRAGASSKSVVVEVTPPRPMPIGSYLAAAVASALLLGALAMIVRRRPVRDDAAHVASHAPAPNVPVGSGVSLGKRGLRGLITADHGISGVVWDPVDEKPVRDAIVELACAGAAYTARTDDRGRFAFEELPAGDCRLDVRCEGYVSETLDRGRIPHRGELRQMRVDLVPVRVRILELYRGVALRLLPERDLWARWTPRDLLLHRARQRGETPEALDELSTLLERAYWSSRLAGSAELRRAEGLAHDLTVEDHASPT